MSIFFVRCVRVRNCSVKIAVWMSFKTISVITKETLYSALSTFVFPTRALKVLLTKHSFPHTLSQGYVLGFT